MIFWKESVMEKSLIKKIAEIAVGGLYKDLIRKIEKDKKNDFCYYSSCWFI